MVTFLTQWEGVNTLTNIYEYDIGPCMKHFLEISLCILHFYLYKMSYIDLVYQSDIKLYLYS